MQPLHYSARVSQYLNWPFRERQTLAEIAPTSLPNSLEASMTQRLNFIEHYITLSFSTTRLLILSEKLLRPENF